MSRAPRWGLPSGTLVVSTLSMLLISATAVTAQDEAASARACAHCHEAIFLEWQASEHAGAWTDPIFTAAHHVEGGPFCDGCHAPLRSTIASSWAEGITCVVCHPNTHDTGGTGALASPMVRRSRSSRAPPQARPCAACHQFDFPSSRGLPGSPPLPMQSTVDEWASSDAGRRGVGCADCHMPLEPGTGRRTHRFEGVARAGLVSAVNASATARRAGRQVHVAILLRATGAAGHAVPTGDIFRRLQVSAWVPTQRRPVATRDLSRVFRTDLAQGVDGSWALVRRQVSDDRIPSATSAAPLRIVLRLFPVPLRISMVGWSVAHLRMPEPMARTRGIPDVRNRTPMAAELIRVAD